MHHGLEMKIERGSREAPAGLLGWAQAWVVDVTHALPAYEKERQIIDIKHENK